MIVNSFAIATLYAIQKQLIMTLPSNQAVLFYKLTLFLVIAPWVLRNGIQAIKTPQLKLHIIRSFLSISGSLCFSYGLKHTTLVNATALNYMEQVLWTIIGIWYFKEKLTKTKLAAIIMSFAAVMLIIFPTLLHNIWMIVVNSGEGSAEAIAFNYYYIFVFAAVIFWALNTTVIKILGKKARNDVQAFYVLLFSVIFAYPTAFLEWSWHSIEGTILFWPEIIRIIPLSEIHLTQNQIIQILMLALMYFLHVMSFFLSVKYADMSTVAPFDYTRLIFTCVLAYYFVGDVPQYVIQYVGYCMIIASGLLLIRSEQKKRKKERLLQEKQKLEEQIENA